MRTPNQYECVKRISPTAAAKRLFHLVSGRYRAGKRIAPSPAEPLFEPLEQRLFLSGDVTAAVSGAGNLVITGDAAANAITIDQGGLGSGQFRIGATYGATTINGAAGPAVFSGVTGTVVMDFDDGADFVEVDGAALPGHLVIDGGLNGCTISLINSATVAGSAAIHAASGTLYLHMSSMAEIAGHLKAVSTNGTSMILLSGAQIGGNVKVLSGSAMDYFLLTDATIGGSAAVYAGGGTNLLQLNNAAVMGNLLVKNGDGDQVVRFLNSGFVGNHVKVVNGDGDHTLHINDGGCLGNLAVVNGSGDHTITVENCSVIDGTIGIRNGTGNHQILLDDTAVNGSVVVKNWGGNCTTDIKAGTGILGHFFLAGLAGNTATTFDGSAIGGSVVIRMGGNGNNSLTLDTTPIMGNLNVVYGGGDDIVACIGGSVNGSVKYNGGNGYNCLVMYGGATVDGHLAFASGYDGSQCYADEANFHGNVYYRGKAGTNLFTATGCTYLGTVGVKTGNDVDAISIADSALGGKSFFRTSGGDDQLWIETGGAPAGPTTTFGLTARIATGSGNDQVTIGTACEAGNAAVFSSHLFINGGSGADTCDYMGNGNTFAALLGVHDFETEL